MPKPARSDEPQVNQFKNEAPARRAGLAGHVPVKFKGPISKPLFLEFNI